MIADPTLTVTLLVLVKGIAWGGSSAIVMWLASHYGDRIDAFKKLDGWKQRLLMIVAATIISWVAYTGVTYIPDTFWQAAQPYFLIASMVAGPILAGQGIYLARRLPAATEAVKDMQPVVAQLDTDMSKIRDAGLVVPDDSPLLPLLKSRVAAEAAAQIPVEPPKPPTPQPPAPPAFGLR